MPRADGDWNRTLGLAWLRLDPGALLLGRVGGRQPAPRGAADWREAPPAAASNRACGSPAHGSPTSFTGWHTRAWVAPFRSGDGCRAESPTRGEAGDPVAAVESVLGAGEDREALVDVGVDLGELPRRVAVAEVIAPAAQRAVEILDRPFQRQPRVPALGAGADLASDRGHRPP